MKRKLILSGFILLLLPIALLTVLSFGEEPATGTLCLAPLHNAPIAIYPNGADFCRVTGKAEVRVDDQPPLNWPNDKELKIAGLDLSSRHRVVIVCRGKPAQTFRFHFSRADNKRVCLLMNDLHGWAQLFQPKGALGCPCK
jgi:hypothetical protein